jgi:hypothetical protein
MDFQGRVNRFYKWKNHRNWYGSSLNILRYGVDHRGSAPVSWARSTPGDFPDWLLGAINTGGFSRLAPGRDQHREIFTDQLLGAILGLTAINLLTSVLPSPKAAPEVLAIRNWIRA